eukprot:GHVU01220720.1.p1 GENE.GHVU01220720.1~~GHVU01220720.1.p1  ORF type:complete len:179 (+),score=16.37 GHVU01220720.1:64-600(+)
MPKVISFGNKILTNHRTNLRDDKFHVFHCKRCRTHVVITDADLGNIPRRRTDSAPVFDMSKWVVKLHTKVSEQGMKIRRPGGLETQYMHQCPSCDLEIGYQCTPPNEPAQFRFIYLMEKMVHFPDFKPKTPWCCTVCGYVARSKQSLQIHFKQRGHENQELGQFKDQGNQSFAPVIVG